MAGITGKIPMSQERQGVPCPAQLPAGKASYPWVLCPHGGPSARGLPVNPRSAGAPTPPTGAAVGPSVWRNGSFRYPPRFLRLPRTHTQPQSRRPTAPGAAAQTDGTEMLPGSKRICHRSSLNFLVFSTTPPLGYKKRNPGPATVLNADISD
ncbi:hypothetical protein CB1_000309019 [Camelus ferus]|nr:hypothetical protein CB1_000309019 [Camelus ferus]